MKKLAIICLFGFSTSLIYAEGSFSVQNNIANSNGVSYYIHLGQNGGSNGITIKDNPDNDSWYLDGTFASKGNQAHYYITSPDNFKQPTHNATDVPAYPNFSYNTSANLDIYIYDNQNTLITKCPVENVYYKNHGHVAISQDTQSCNNPLYQVQDDRNNGFHPGTLYVHSVPSVKVGITNKAPKGYTVDLGNNDNIKMIDNPDKDVWVVTKSKATSGQNAYYTIGSNDSFSVIHIASYGYNSEAQLSFNIYNDQNQLVTTCKPTVFFYNKAIEGYLTTSLYMTNKYFACSNSSFYLTGDDAPISGYEHVLLTLHKSQ